MPSSSRKQCRRAEHCDIRSLADAVYHVVHHSPLGAREIAERIGVRYAYLLDCANSDREEMQLQARLIAPLTHVTGDTAIVEQLASVCGGVFVPLPSVTAAAPDVIEQTTRAVREFGELLAVTASASADGIVTVAEAGTVAKRGRALIAEATRLVQMMEQQAGIGPLREVNRG